MGSGGTLHVSSHEARQQRHLQSKINPFLVTVIPLGLIILKEGFLKASFFSKTSQPLSRSISIVATSGPSPK